MIIIICNIIIIIIISINFVVVVVLYSCPYVNITAIAMKQNSLVAGLFVEFSTMNPSARIIMIMMIVCLLLLVMLRFMILIVMRLKIKFLWTLLTKHLNTLTFCWWYPVTLFASQLDGAKL